VLTAFIAPRRGSSASTSLERKPLLVEVRVKSLGLDRRTDSPVVILEEAAGDRVLPIWIGPSEASAIAMRLAGMEYDRPLTHDLLVSVVGGLGGRLDRIVIDRVKDQTYFAELMIHRNEEVFQVDARPSDSIAVALRMEAPIYARDDLLELVSIEVTDDPNVVHIETQEDKAPIGMTGEELQEHLRTLNPQDFGRFKP
jgi:uncharacterized protein